MSPEQLETSVTTSTSFLRTSVPILLGLLCIYIVSKLFTGGNKRQDIKEVHEDKNTNSVDVVEHQLGVSNGCTQSVSKSQSKLFTAKEVAQHSSRDDCWIIVDNQVYDVTSYVDEHPGGDSIMNNAGQDSSEGFHGPQHPSRVDDHIKDYCIGDLQPGP